MLKLSKLSGGCVLAQRKLKKFALRRTLLLRFGKFPRIGLSVPPQVNTIQHAR